MLYIKVPDMNDSMSTISIEGTEYLIRFTYNELYDYWSFSLYDSNNLPIMGMVKIVPNFPLNYYFTSSRMPRGVFGCLSDLKNVGRYDFKNQKAEFVFIADSEVVDE